MNLSNEVLFLLQGGAGAVSGYITNKYAVNMLFKEYEPFKIFNKVIIPAKFGGVIKNRKEQFIEEISELVERDIINSNTVLTNINHEKFERVLNDIAKDFFNKELKKSLNNMEFKDINNFENAVEGLCSVFKSALKDDCDLTQYIIERINLNDDVTYELIKSICTDFIDEIIKEAENTNFLSQCSETILKSISNESVDSIISDEIIECVQKSLLDTIDAGVDALLCNDERLIKITDDLFHKANIRNVIMNLQDNLYDKKISDYITNDECRIISHKIFNSIMSYIDSEAGRCDIDSIISFAVSVIEEMDYTIYDLLPENTGNRLTEFIDSTIHKMLPYFSKWIEKNKDEFDTIIEKSIDEAIVSLDPGIKKMIISKVRELFLDNISAKNKIVEKITDFIESYNIDENSLNEISNMVLSYLKNTKINEIFQSIKSSSIIDKGGFEKIIKFIKDLMNANGEKIIYDILKSQTSKTFRDILKADLNDIFKDNIRPLINDYIISHKEYIKNILLENIKGTVCCKITEFKNSHIGHIIDSSIIEKNSDKINSSAKNLIDSNKEVILNNITCYFENALREMKNSKNVRDKITDSSISFIKSMLLEKKDCYIYEAIRDNLCREDVYKTVSSSAGEILKDNLDSLLKGRIKETIKNNLMQYDEDEICDLAQRFMGSELKPLSLFGGILGFICGIVFGMFSRNIGISGFYSNMKEQILSVLLMGAVGVLTNVIAINMLFKPYTKNKVLAKIPFIKNFALGYIPAHKENISRGIGNVIDNELLNKSYISSILNRSKSILKTNLLKIIGNDNYKMISDFLQSKKENISKLLNNGLFSWVNSNKNKIVKSISIYAGSIKADSIMLKKEALDKIIDDAEIEEKIKDISKEYIYEILNGSLKVKDIVPLKLKNNIEDNIYNSIHKSALDFGNHIKSADVKCYISDYVSGLIHDEKNLKDSINSISTYLSEHSLNFIKNAAENNINKLLDSIMYNEHTIESVFDGNIKVYIDKNLFKLTELAVDKIKVLILNNEELIGRSVKSKINESLNFFEKIGYAMAGGDDIVDRAVNIMVEKNLPVFISERFFEITSIIKDGFDNSVYKMKIKEICPQINEDKVNSLINSVFESLNNNEALKERYKSGLNGLLISIAESCTDEDINYVLNKFESEILSSSCDISKNITLNSSEICRYINDICADNILNSVYDLNIKDIFSSYSEESLSKDINNLVFRLNPADLVKDKSYRFLNEYLNGKSINDIISLSKTEEYLDVKLTELLKCDEIRNHINDVINRLIEILIENENKILTCDMKLQICDKICEASLTAAINHSHKIIESMDLKEITRKQIEIMNPRELHELFISFSGTLFKKLYLYGAFGAVFGINLWIPVVLGIKESINPSNPNNEVIEESRTSV